MNLLRFVLWCAVVGFIGATLLVFFVITTILRLLEQLIMVIG